MIQGGDPTGTGFGDPSIPNFDDQFQVDLQHTGTGVLSMAKAGDDTNGSQFFITEIPTRTLDFNHSVFGQLTDGENVRQEISNVAVGGGDRPIDEVVMESVTIFVDEENGVLMLSAPEGTTGGASVTVTATDEDGNTFERTFRVFVQPDPVNDEPFLEDIPETTTSVNTPVDIQLVGIDKEQDPFEFTAFDANGIGATVSVDEAGLVSVTPPTDFVGSFEVGVIVRSLNPRPDPTPPQDQQLFTITVESDAPASVDLLAAFDTGELDDDNITSLTTLEFRIEDVIDGATVTLYAGDVVIGQGTASGDNINITTDAPSALIDGVRTITATQTIAGTESVRSTALLVTIDTAQPGEFFAAAPTSAFSGSLYQYNAETIDETSAAVTYSLGLFAEGMTIDPATGVVRWTPTAAQAGEHTFEVIATDAAGNSRTQTNIVTAIETISADDDSYFVDEDGLLTVIAADGVLANDGVGSPGSLTASLVVGPQNGTLTLESDGSFGFEPDADFFGTDSFTYQASDGNLQSRIVSVSLSVNPIADAPVAADDGYTVSEDGLLLVAEETGLLANDTDVDGDDLTATMLTDPAHGTVTFDSDGSFTYRPDDDFNGTDSFTYESSDGTLTSNTATISIEVTPFNDPPVAEDDAYTVDEDAVLTVQPAGGVLINDTDEEGSALTAAIMNLPSQGTLNFATDGSFTYVPDADFNGTDTFSYKANDNEKDSNVAVVTITVEPTPDPPTATDDTHATSKDAAATRIDVLDNDTNVPDADGPLTVTDVAQGDQGGTITIIDGGDAIEYTPAAGFSGTETFVYTIEDVDGLEAEATVTVTVQDFVSSTISGTLYFDLDDDGAVDRFESTIGGVDIRLTGVDLLDNDVTMTARTAADGSYSFENLLPIEYRVTKPTSVFLHDGIDTLGDSALDSQINDEFTFVLDGQTDMVRANNIFASRGRKAEFVTTRDFLASTPTEYIIAGTDSIDGSQWFSFEGDWGDYVMAEVELSSDLFAFTLTLTDSQGQVFTTTERIWANKKFEFLGVEQTSRLVRLTGSPDDFDLKPVDPPTVSVDADEDLYSIAEDNTLIVSAANGVLANDNASDNSSLSASLQTGPANGTVELKADGSFEYTGNADFHGTDSFVYRATVNGVSSEAMVTITVSPVNDAPVAVDDTGYTVEVNNTLTVSEQDGVLSNDTDVEGDTLTAAIVELPLNGTVTLSDNGEFVYTPDADYVGSDSFTYTANDGQDDSSAATVFISVTAENELPIAGDDQYSADADSSLSVDSASGVLANDSDGNGDQLSAQLVDSPANGAVVLNSDGSFTYAPDAGFVGSDSFTYQANDGEGDSNVATVTIDVVAVNQAPVAVDDAFVMQEDAVLTVGVAESVLSNDTDGEGDSLTAVLVDGPANGTLVLEADGSFLYTPDADFDGDDSFTYRAADGLLESNIATVTIAVLGVNDAPVAFNDDYIVNMDTELTADVAGGILANDTDVDSPVITASLTSLPSSGTLTLEDDGSFSYTPDIGFFGSDSFTYVANDSETDSNEATVTITVLQVNRAPLAFDDQYDSREDATLTVQAVAGVLANDFDPNSDQLTVTLVSQSSNGTVTLAADGSFVYVPTVGFVGDDSFSYISNDGEFDSNEATVTIHVASENLPPEANDDAYEVVEDSQLIVDAAGGILENDIDENGDPLSILMIVAPNSGDLVMEEDGSFVYSPDADFFGTDSFTYKLSDGVLFSNDATVTIVVEGVNDAPVAVEDEYSGTEDEDLVVDLADGILSNDYDVDGDDLIIEILQQPVFGSLDLDEDGSFVYTPDFGHTGVDSFSYRLNDGITRSNEVSVTLMTISGEPDGGQIVTVPTLFVNLETGNLTIDYASLDVTSIVIASASGVFSGSGSPQWDMPSSSVIDEDEIISNVGESEPLSGVDDLGDNVLGDLDPNFDLVADLSFRYLALDGSELFDGDIVIESDIGEGESYANAVDAILADLE